MPDRTFPTRPPWADEKDPQNARIADLVLDELLAAGTLLHRGNADELGVDPSMLAILETLGVFRWQTVASLADRVALSHAATSRAVARLEERRWVERVGEPGERRLVTRAPGTSAVIAASRQDVRSPLAAAAGALDAGHRDAVLGFLEEASRVLQARALARGDHRLRRSTERRRKEWERARRRRVTES